MDTQSETYRKLQKHLDTMPVGFPPTKAGFEINVLKTIFTPEEAEVTTHLDYKYKSVDEIFNTAKSIIDSKERLKNILDAIVSKGGISWRERDEGDQYAVAPPVLWGVYEYQLKILNPDFLSNMGKYMMSELGFELAISNIPKTRIIPVEESIEAQHNVSTYEELRNIIENAGDHISVQECICRKLGDLQGKSCQETDRREICMAFGDLADLYVREGWGRRIDKHEALELARKNEEEGLVLQPANQQEPQFLCACCSDCCGSFSMIKNFPKPADVVGHNYFISVDINACNGCGICVERCKMEATKVTDNISVVNMKRCIGCGLCVSTCSQTARHLVKKGEEVIPPKNVEEFYDTIMAPKKTLRGRMRNSLMKTLLRVLSRFSR